MIVDNENLGVLLIINNVLVGTKRRKKKRWCENCTQQPSRMSCSASSTSLKSRHIAIVVLIFKAAIVALNYSRLLDVYHKNFTAHLLLVSIWFDLMGPKNISLFWWIFLCTLWLHFIWGIEMRWHFLVEVWVQTLGRSWSLTFEER